MSIGDILSSIGDFVKNNVEQPAEKAVKSVADTAKAGVNDASSWLDSQKQAVLTSLGINPQLQQKVADMVSQEKGMGSNSASGAPNQLASTDPNLQNEQMAQLISSMGITQSPDGNHTVNPMQLAGHIMGGSQGSSLMKGLSQDLGMPDHPLSSLIGN